MVFCFIFVKDFNFEDEVEGYVDLVQKGFFCFVEIKGVIYCGIFILFLVGLMMQNVFFYNEVCDFVVVLEKVLKKRGLNYGIVVEYVYSCCILLVSDRFQKEGKWYIRIDYERFFELLEERGLDGEFMLEEYMGFEMLEWVMWGRGGFDLRDQRVDRKGRLVEVLQGFIGKIWSVGFKRSFGDYVKNGLLKQKSGIFL